MRRKMSRVLREMLAEDKCIIAPGCFDPLTARIVEATGFKCAYMSGSGTSMFTLGWPDMAFITLTEMAGNASRIACMINIPLISDADTGFGNALNVRRCVQQFIQGGVAAIHIEDQIFPKRCGHTAGRICISEEEMIGKIRAASDMRNELDPDFVIIGRCDFRGAVGGSLEGAIARSNSYVDAGADVVFVEGLLSVDELKYAVDNVKAPLLYNMGGLSPTLTEEELNDIGVKIVILAGASTTSAYRGVLDYMTRIKKDLMYQKEFVEQRVTQGGNEVFQFVGFQKMQELEEKYLPKEMLDARYGQPSIGTFQKESK